MERERLGRRLSVVMTLAGGALFVLNITIGDVVDSVFGVLSAGIGLAFYLASDRIFDADAEFDLTETHSFVMNLVQLGVVLFAFALLTYLLSDARTVTSVFRTGVPSPPYPAYAGVLMGVLLGGGNAYLTQRWDTLKASTQSIPVRTVGFSLTFGTYVVLLLHQPPSSVLYAGAYAVSRLAVLLGVYLPARH